ncbi:hypothetical protein Sjap_003833 [Stephania japonica]|uniref:Uncharacterized protein n=1 Tax=Stephania japonica TaxID=461633 RepID=A0AAP0PTZ0_9MAGN
MKSCFYYLPDSMPVNKAFQRLKGAWFLRVNVTPVVCSDKHCPPENLVAKPRNSASCSSNVIDCQNPEDSTGRPSTSDKKDDVERKRGESPPILDNAMAELLLPVNVPKGEKTLKRKRRELSPILNDVMEELLMPVYVPKRKKTRTSSHSHEKVLDGARSEEALLDTIKEVRCVSSQGRLQQCNTLKRKDRKQVLASSQPNENDTSPGASDIVSVTGILTRYFPDFDEVKAYAGSSSNKIVDRLENETYQADQDENLKSNAAENSSVPIGTANNAPPEIPRSVSPTKGNSSAKHGKSMAGKPMPSKTALPDSPKPKTAKVSKLQRSKVTKLLPPKVPSIDKPSPNTLRSRIETSCEVGKRLVQAANDLGIPTSKRKPIVLSCKSKGIKFSSTLVRKLEFDFE